VTYKCPLNVICRYLLFMGGGGANINTEFWCGKYWYCPKSIHGWNRSTPFGDHYILCIYASPDSDSHSIEAELHPKYNLEASWLLPIVN
jgi:hypothetical protein